jgi:hypothetical protein
MATLHLSRSDGESHPALRTLTHVFWALCAAIVVLFIFFAALGAVEPGDAVELTVVVVALAAAWLAHAWRDLWRDERRERAD